MDRVWRRSKLSQHTRQMGCAWLSDQYVLVEDHANAQSGRTVFTAGPDQRVCQFTCIASPNSPTRWVQSGSKRIHSHDIRALAVFPPYTPYSAPLNPHLAPVLASGGWDMSVAFTPAASSDLLVNTVKNPLSKSTGMSRVVFDEGFSRKMSYSGGGRGTGCLSVSRKGRLVVSRSDRGVGIWRVLDEEQGWEKLLDMELRVSRHLYQQLFMECSCCSYGQTWFLVQYPMTESGWPYPIFTRRSYSSWNKRPRGLWKLIVSRISCKHWKRPSPSRIYLYRQRGQDQALYCSHRTRRG